MGLFNKLKAALTGKMGETLQSAVDAAKDAVKDAVSDKVTEAAQGVVGGAADHLRGVPGGAVVADEVQSGANAAVASGVDAVAETATNAVGTPSGEDAPGTTPPPPPAPAAPPEPQGT